ncbi:xyloglucan xylosyltransferase 5 [Actinidia rufa]|uniref:Xyloglucan xylosyltransferase 5 n=1 Tax=Actinidia rufa TaxID=165716 RepID=A0A7J0FZI5_9ERIC|nr:xyloglucan xylosyltransferase 5 [Actinidia rufa]
MGQETLTAQKRGGALPTTTANGGRSTAGRAPRGWQIQRTFNNIKITVLCGFVTILVLRGYIGVNLGTSDADAINSHLLQETNRILVEIRSDSDPDDLAEPEINPNVTYTLGPKISNWDQERKIWLDQNPQFPNSVNDCVYNMAHLERELAGYWAKLPLIRRLMLSHPEVEWIWWMDSDALFTDMVFELPLSKYNDYNMIIHGYPDLLFNQKSWIAVNTGSFLFRNCQWSLDLLDAWAPMGPKGRIRDEAAGKILTANLKGRPAFEADDQSALIYLMISQKDQWMDKVFLENSFYLHGYWAGLVDRYEEMIEKYHPGLGDERWPFVTHFVGCKPCGSYGDYPVERCLSSMERAFNFADNQVLKLYGFRHRGLLSPKIKRIRNETATPLEFVDQFDIRRPVHGSSGS